ncbi:hypothetical protein D3C87_1931050 [compost metagenome]
MPEVSATHLSRQICQVSQITSSAVSPVEKIAPARTAKFESPNSIWPRLLIQYPAIGFSK